MWSSLIMKRYFDFSRLLPLAVALSLSMGSLTTGRAVEGSVEPGLMVRFAPAAGSLSSDLSVTPNIRLYVREGESPGPFIASGKFTATWEGEVSAELRSDFSFQAELNGTFKLEINGKLAYEAEGTGASAAALSKPVQLNKGPNSLRAIYTSPAKGDAFIRLSWTEKVPFTAPIPNVVLTHQGTPELKRALQTRIGRELFLEYRCANCHKMEWKDTVPELQMDAPSFAGIGARRNYEWMARWILDPKSSRANVHMPAVLHGPQAKEDAEAIAAYLASLKTGGDVALTESNSKSKPASGGEPDAAAENKDLFDTLRCVACHYTPGDAQTDTNKISLTHVAQKFAPGKLAEFLEAPEAHFAWIRMPNFQLSKKEATELSEFLLGKAEKSEAKDAPGDKAVLDRGQRLVQESGCLNCHSGVTLVNRFSAPELSGLANDKWTQGCLSAETKDGKAPKFGFSAEQREVLKAFGQTDRKSLTRYVPSEFAERQTRLLNCTGCHGQVEGFPPLELLGGKLRPEWAAKFIAGEIPYKPRGAKHPKGEPWLALRMPAFKSRATLLANGLAAEHGFPPQTPTEPAVDTELAKLGQKLVGKDGGFSCNSCHGVGKVDALEVFESEGINFAYSADRLLPQYYRRWVRNPTSIDPTTKMPVYFEDGKSPLTDVLDGDGEKQINAIWQYIRLGEKMPPPSSGAQ